MHILSYSKTAAALGLVACTILGAPSARAADFTFTTGDTTLPAGTGERVIDAYYPALRGRNLGSNLELQMQPIINDLTQTLQSTIETRLNSLNLAPLVSRSATAEAAVARATNVDHASFFKLFSITAAGSAAITGFDGLRALKDPASVKDDVQSSKALNFGAAPGASAMVGFNFGALNLRKLGFFNPNRLQLFVTAMYLSFKYRGDELVGKHQVYGAHLKYQLFAPDTLTANNLVRWGGLNISSGLTFAGQDLAFNTALPDGTSEQTAAIAVGGVQDTLRFTGTWTGDADINLRLRAYTVPLEVSSFIQLLYVLTLFGGVAMDLNFGAMAIDAGAKAPLTVSASSDRSPTTVRLLTPQPTLTFAMKKSPTIIDGRAFLGLQLNLGVVAIYVQGMVDTSETVLASMGIRGFY